MMKTRASFLVCCVTLAACETVTMRPGNDPSEIADRAITKGEVNESCKKETVGNDQAKLKTCGRVMLAYVDHGYYKFKQRLFRQGRVQGMIFDALGLSVTTATGLVSGNQAKDNLAAAGTFLDGAKAVMDKTVLQSNLQSIVRQMDRDREDYRREIEEKLDGTDYSLAGLMADANLYYLAGTVPEAIRMLAKSAEKGERAEEMAGAVRAAAASGNVEAVQALLSGF